MPVGFLVSQQLADQISQGLIDGADTDNCIAPASYLLRVGGYLESARDQPTSLRPGEAVVIQPRAFLLLGTMEKVTLPENMIGFLYLRSSYARRGLLPWSQGIVEPGYSGAITVVAHNHSGDYLPIVGGEKICHLMLSLTENATAKPYGSRPQNDVYQNSAAATPAKEGSRVKVAGQVGEVVGQMLGGFSRSYLNF